MAWFQKFYYALHVENDNTKASSLLSTIKTKYSNDDAEGEIEFAQSMLSPSTKLINGPGQQIYKNSNSTAEKALPKESSLSGNYPNPFNPTTIISYQLSAVSNVNLIVYDVLGREVATLKDGMKNAGSYFATFDGSRLSSGIYFVRFTVQPQDGSKQIVLTRKMLMMK
jgi:hypothetical protein